MSENSIVGVPGLGSHAFGTWKGINGYRMWLRDFLPKDKAFKSARIMLYGYRSDHKDNPSLDHIQEYARRLLIQLQHVRSEENVIPLLSVFHKAILFLPQFRRNIDQSSSSAIVWET
jgi:hypothetical protein